MPGCRDCKVCTRSPLNSCLIGLVKLPLYLLHGITLGLSFFILKTLRSGKRRCPQCGHYLSEHTRRTDGSFVD